MKGYTYQQHVFAMFLALMDTERQISKIEVESLDTKNFDDMYMETVGENKSSYRVQIKNYPDTLIGDIKIENSKVVIKNNVNEYDSPDTNVLVVNTDKIVIDDKFMGLFCTRINDIVIIPLTVDTIMDLMDAMFEKPEREIQIYHLAEVKTEKAIFHVTIDELPELIQLSSDLDNHTVLLRSVPDELKKVLHISREKLELAKAIM